MQGVCVSNMVGALGAALEGGDKEVGTRVNCEFGCDCDWRVQGFSYNFVLHFLMILHWRALDVGAYVLKRLSPEL